MLNLSLTDTCFKNISGLFFQMFRSKAKLHSPLWSNFSGPDNLDNLRRLAEQFQKQAAAAGGSDVAAGIPPTIPEEDDDEVPDLVPGETFEEVAEEKKEKESS
jgi:hypothetical protein